MPADKSTPVPRPADGDPARPPAGTVAELVRAAIAGDEQAFRAVHDRYAPGLRRLMLERASGRADVADDLAQRAWSLAWGALQKGSYDPTRAAFSTFLYAVAHKVWLQHLRRAGRQGPTLPESFDAAGPAVDPADASGTAEVLQTVRDLLAGKPVAGEGASGLSEHDRAVLRALGEGASDRDLARTLGVAPSTAHARKRAAMDKLRELLGRCGITSSALRGKFGPDE